MNLPIIGASRKVSLVRGLQAALACSAVTLTTIHRPVVKFQSPEAAPKGASIKRHLRYA